MIWLRRQGFAYLALFMMLAICQQVRCTRRNQSSEVMPAANQNTGNNAPTQDSGREEIQLDLKSDRVELGPGDCTDLRLDVLNHSTRVIRWGSDLELEQQGPSPPLPDGLGGEVKVPPGLFTDFMAVRICSANRLPGTYRFRITSARKSANPIHSNWITIEILP